jgi:hypothetical protein
MERSTSWAATSDALQPSTWSCGAVRRRKRTCRLSDLDTRGRCGPR